MKIDLRNKEINFLSYHIEEGKGVHQIVFGDTTIVLDDKQMNRISGQDDDDY